MGSGRLSWLFAPWHVAALATGAKSFRDNPVIGSPALNRAGLHVARVRLAHRMAEWRRQRLSDPDFRRGSRGFRARRLYPQTRLFARCRLCGAQRPGLVVPRTGAASAPGRCADPAHRPRPPNPGRSAGFARDGRQPGMARPRALCRLVHAGTADLYPNDLLACAPGAARPADAAACRRVSSLGQSLVLFDGCQPKRTGPSFMCQGRTGRHAGASVGNAARR